MHATRVEVGRRLASEAPAEADLVIPVPESGTPAAVGYSQGSGIPYGLGLVKNSYVGRTFIQPSQTIRQLGIRLKLNPLREVIAGQRLVVVDDSIVRGNTQRALVRMLREAGAAEVHVRISSPPVKWPCFYGIDFASPAELIANGLAVEEIRASIDADSLAYISLEGLVEATEQPMDNLCRACFDGVYPVALPEPELLGKHLLEVEPVTHPPSAHHAEPASHADAGRRGRRRRRAQPSLTTARPVTSGPASRSPAAARPGADLGEDLHRRLEVRHRLVRVGPTRAAGRRGCCAARPRGAGRPSAAHRSSAASVELHGAGRGRPGAVRQRQVVQRRHPQVAVAELLGQRHGCCCSWSQRLARVVVRDGSEQPEQVVRLARDRGSSAAPRPSAPPRPRARGPVDVAERVRGQAAGRR